MRKSAVLTFNNRRIVDTLKKNNVLIILSVCYILGLLLGVLCLKNVEAIFEIAVANFSKYYSVRITEKFFGVFIHSFSAYLPFAFLLFLSGTSIAGMALVPIAVCYCGFDYGIFSAFLYKNFLLQGIAINALLVIPCTLFAVFGYLLSAREAMRFSSRLVKISLPRGQAANIYNDFRIYWKRFVLILLLFIAASLLDTILSISFLKLFNL